LRQRAAAFRETKRAAQPLRRDPVGGTNLSGPPDP